MARYKDLHYFVQNLELLNKRIFFSRKHNIMFLTTPKCGSQFVKLFCLLNFTNENPKHIIPLQKHNNTIERFFREYKTWCYCN